MKICAKKLEVKVLNSQAGYYIGTITTEDGFPEPNCRISYCYYKKEKDAQHALDTMTFIERDMAPEVQFCNGGRCDGCRIRDAVVM